MGLGIGKLYFWGTLSLAVYFLTGLYFYNIGNWEGNKNCFNLFAKCLGILCIVFICQSVIMNVQVYAIGSIISLIVLYTINFLILSDQKYLKNNAVKTRKVDEVQLQNIINAVENLFEENKIYRQKGLTLATVSKAIAFPSYQVSKAINHYFSTNFNQFVNQYRIKEAKTLLQDQELNGKIEVIAKEVGFSSATSLYHAFKKEMKITPQTYRNQVKD